MRVVFALGLVALSGAVALCSRERSGPRGAAPSSTLPPSASSSSASVAADAAVLGARLPPDAMLKSRLDELRRGGRETPYAEPTDGELDAYQSFVAAALVAARADGAPPVPPKGFAIEAMTATTGPLWIIAEQATRRRGAGAIVLRRGSARDVGIEAPHTFFDVGTLPIALAAFEQTRARFLLVNTVHRYATRLQQRAGSADGADGESDDDAAHAVASDVAHAPRSFFLSAHDTLAIGGAVQFHGFRDALVEGAEVVLSAAGTSAPVAAAARAARDVLGAAAVRVYPSDVNMLGGTTNVQSRSSLARGRAFLHVEMSRTVRDRFLADPPLLARFIDAVVAPLSSGATTAERP